MIHHLLILLLILTTTNSDSDFPAETTEEEVKASQQFPLAFLINPLIRRLLEGSTLLEILVQSDGLPPLTRLVSRLLLKFLLK